MIIAREVENMKRKFKKILFHSAGKMVMFEMENGWYYDVDLKQKKIFVFWIPDIYLKFDPYVESQVPDDVKQKAIKMLDTLPIETAKVGRTYQRKYGFKYVEGTPNLEKIRMQKAGLID
jgi:hypothetical protein